MERRKIIFDFFAFFFGRKKPDREIPIVPDMVRIYPFPIVVEKDEKESVFPKKRMGFFGEKHLVRKMRIRVETDDDVVRVILL